MLSKDANTVKNQEIESKIWFKKKGRIIGLEIVGAANPAGQH